MFESGAFASAAADFFMFGGTAPFTIGAATGVAPFALTGGVVGGAIGKKLSEDKIDYYKQNKERMGIVEGEIEKTTKEIAQLEQEMAGLNESSTKLEKKYSMLKYENKIMKYSRLLDTLQKNGKIYDLVVDIDDLIVYGPEFHSALQRRIDLVKDDSSKTEEEIALEVEALGSVLARSKSETDLALRKQIDRQAQEPGSSFLPDLRENIRAAAQEIADAEGRDLTKEDFTTAAGKVDPAASLQSVSNTKPGKGVADSDPSLRNKRRIYYFYYGDLVDTALRLNPNWEAQVYTQMEQDQNAIILGPGYAEVEEGTVTTFNVADVPIPLDLYQEFFYKNIIEKDIDQYNVNQFLKDTMNQLVAVFLNQKCSGESVLSPVTVQSSVVNYGMTREAAYKLRTEGRQYKQGQGDYDKFVDLDFNTVCPVRVYKADAMRRVEFADPSANPKVEREYNNRILLLDQTAAAFNNLSSSAAFLNSIATWSYTCFHLETSSFKRTLNGNIEEDAKKRNSSSLYRQGQGSG